MAVSLRQDRKRRRDLVAVTRFEAEFGPGALNVDLENVRAVWVDADGGVGDYLAEDRDEDLRVEGRLDGGEVGEVDSWERLAWGSLELIGWAGKNGKERIQWWKKLEIRDGHQGKAETEREIHIPHTPSAFSDEEISNRPFSLSVISDDTTAAAPLIFPSSPKLATHSVSSGLAGWTNPRSGNAERIS